jgi:predicted transcriptional regulator
MAKRPQLSFEVEPDLIRRLKIVAARDGESVSAILRRFVAWYVDKEEKRVGV